MAEANDNLFAIVERKDLGTFAKIFFKVAAERYERYGLAVGVAIGYQDAEGELYTIAKGMNLLKRKGWGGNPRGEALRNLEITLEGGNNAHYPGVLTFEDDSSPEIRQAVSILSDDGKGVGNNWDEENVVKIMQETLDRFTRGDYEDIDI